MNAHPSVVTSSPLSTIVGRDQEIRTIRSLIESRSVRLVTLTGPGGVGKTRIAHEIISQIQHAGEMETGFLSLEDVPADGARDAFDQIVDERRSASNDASLLVLDNLEQLTDAARHVADLLQRYPAITVLATSRSRLRLRGEHEVVIQPLAVPGDEDVRADWQAACESPAVALFIDRASATRSEFAVTEANVRIVVEICRRLDGLPLAIELAALKLKLLSPAALLAALDSGSASPAGILAGGAADAPDRHQSIDVSIATSFALLGADEQQLFLSLSAFSGTCSLAALAAVDAELHGTTRPILATIDALLERSMLSIVPQEDEGDPASTMRIGLLRTYRDFSRTRLHAEGLLEAAARAHAAYYLLLVEAAEPDLTNARHPRTVGRLRAEMPNITAAFDWACQHDPTVAIRLAGALWRYWSYVGGFHAGRTMLDRALNLDSSDETPQCRAARACAFYGAGVLAWQQCDNAIARPLLERSSTLWDQLGDLRGRAYCLKSLGQWELSERNLAAWSLIEESTTLFRADGDAWGLAFSLNPLGHAFVSLGRYDDARMALDESRAIFDRLGDDWGVALAGFNLGRLAIEQRDWESAQLLLEQSVAVFRSNADPWRVGAVLTLLGDLYLQLGRVDAAIFTFTESAAINRACGQRQRTAYALRSLGILAHHHGDIDRAMRHLAESLQASLEIGDSWGASITNRVLSELTVARPDAEAGQTAPERSAPAKVARRHTLLPDHLTEREVTVLRLLAEGRSNPEIADTLVISVATAASHVRNIFAKIGASNRVEAAMYATRHGMGPQLQ